MSEDTAPSEEDVNAITDRIRKITQARVMADTGKLDKALEILRGVRNAYDDERMRKMVDWMIEDYERRKGGS